MDKETANQMLEDAKTIMYAYISDMARMAPDQESSQGMLDAWQWIVRYEGRNPNLKREERLWTHGQRR